MGKTRGGILLVSKAQLPTATWEWQDQAQGLVKWTFTNPNSVQVSAILTRGVNDNGQVVEVYPFGEAFFPLYWQNFNTPFVTGKPEPLKDSGLQSNQPPLSIIANPDGSMFVAFLFTLAPGQSWSMLEGGFQGTSPATPVMHVGVFSQAANVTITYNRVQQCSQYNQQAGTNFSCPANPMVLDSSIIHISDQVSRLISDPISEKKIADAKSCMKKLDKAWRKGDLTSFLEALRKCILGL